MAFLSGLTIGILIRNRKSSSIIPWNRIRGDIWSLSIFRKSRKQKINPSVSSNWQTRKWSGKTSIPKAIRGTSSIVSFGWITRNEILQCYYKRRTVAPDHLWNRLRGRIIAFSARLSTSALCWSAANVPQNGTTTAIMSKSLNAKRAAGHAALFVPRAGPLTFRRKQLTINKVQNYDLLLLKLYWNIYVS